MKHQCNPEKNSRISYCNRLSRWLGSGCVVIAASGWLAVTVSPARADCVEGCDITISDTYLGNDVLISDTGGGNTGVGFEALNVNNTGSQNTATGLFALGENTSGNNNTATGALALETNKTTDNNTANGYAALEKNTGSTNTAVGASAMLKNTTGSNNVANGANALENNTTGDTNTADGTGALKANKSGSDNTAEGYRALFNNTGSSNIALGSQAGLNLTSGSNNIDIAAQGIAGESATMRLGERGLQDDTYIAGVSGVVVAGGVDVIIDTNGHLGTVVSSARYKENIGPMDKASETIFSLQPVTFRYKKELDPEAIPQFGLVAEQVEKVAPDLVARDEQGKPYSVRYQAVNAMLLNEFIKEHRKVETLEAAVARRQEAIDALTSQLHEITSRLTATDK